VLLYVLLYSISLVCVESRVMVRPLCVVSFGSTKRQAHATAVAATQDSLCRSMYDVETIQPGQIVGRGAVDGRESRNVTYRAVGAP